MWWINILGLALIVLIAWWFRLFQGEPPVEDRNHHPGGA